MERYSRACDSQIRRFRTTGHTVRKRLAILGKRAARDESGSLTIFAVYVFVMMLMIGGIGIDLMRFERDRTQLQSTLDRAVLAAADLDQALKPQDVVNDYFAKAGFGDYLANVTVQQGLNYRRVSATASGEFKTQFMHMGGVDTLQTPAAGTAEERIDGVEISLVLDVSGSMNQNSKLTNLKSAAKDFVDEMFDNTEENKVTISIVPYATQVAVPDYMARHFNITREIDEGETTATTFSTCVNFAANDFSTPAIDPAAPLQHTMHFDPWYDWDGRDNDPVELIGADDNFNSSLPVCEVGQNVGMGPVAPSRTINGLPSREILPISANRAALKAYIDGFRARGNTSIDIGMKWGTALLDPSLRPVIDGMIGTGEVSSAFDARPHLYDDNETIKVIVLMTDGQNTSQYYINEGYRTGDSNVWFNEQEEEYSVYVGLDDDDEDNDGITNEPMFYWPNSQLWAGGSGWHDHAYGEGTYDKTETTYECRSYRRNGSCRRYRQKKTTVTVDEPGHAEIVKYRDLWAYTTVGSVVVDLYQSFMTSEQAWNDWYHGVVSSVGSTTKDNRTASICTAAKNQGVIVFTIGFEAPQRGLDVLRPCASSPSHFFDVAGLEISDAFSAIASSIRKLRLTQ